MERRGGDLVLGGGRLASRAAAIAACLVLANCASSDKFARNVDPKYGVASSPRVVDAGQPVPKGGGTYRVGKPYTVAGRSYTPETNEDYTAEGMASWYGDDFHGRLTANGEVFDMHSISAAHPTLPMPSYARVTNLANKKSIVVRVRVEYVGRAPLEGSDDRQLIATLRDGEAAPAPSAVRVASAKPFLPEQKPAVAEAVGRSPNLPEISAQASMKNGPAAPAFGRAAADRNARV